MPTAVVRASKGRLALASDIGGESGGALPAEEAAVIREDEAMKDGADAADPAGPAALEAPVPGCADVPWSLKCDVTEG